MYTYHPIHETDKTPKSNGIILHDRIYWGQQIAHALHIPEIAVILIIRQEHIFQLLEMHIRADLGER